MSTDIHRAKKPQKHSRAHCPKHLSARLSSIALEVASSLRHKALPTHGYAKSQGHKQVWVPAC